MNAYALRGRDSVVYLQAVQAERIQRGSVHAFFVYTTNRSLGFHFTSSVSWW